MKKLSKIFLSFVFFSFALLNVNMIDAKVKDTTRVSVTIEGNKSTLLPETKIDVKANDISQIVGGNEAQWTSKTTAMHSLIAALENEKYDIKNKNVLDASVGKYAYISSILNLKASGNAGWMFAVNNISPTDSVDQYGIKDNDRIVFYFNEDYTKQYYSFFDKTTISAYTNDTIELFSKKTIYDEEWNSVNRPVEGARLIISPQPTHTSEIISDSTGKFTFKIDKAGTYYVNAYKDNEGINELTRNTTKIVVKDKVTKACTQTGITCDSRGRIIKRVNKYKNGKVNKITVIKYQGKTNNRQSYNEYIYNPKGVNIQTKYYTKFKNNKYRTRIIIKRDAKHQMIYKQIVNKDNKYKIRKTTTYNKFIKNKYRQRAILTYRANGKKQNLTILKRNKKGNKTEYIK